MGITNNEVNWEYSTGKKRWLRGNINKFYRIMNAFTKKKKKKKKKTN